MPAPLNNLCLHTITNKPWSVDQCIAAYAKAGIGGITLWRKDFEGQNLAQLRERIDSAGLELVSLCRGGFFVGKTKKERHAAIDDNLLMIDQAAAVGAPQIVLVCGAVPNKPLVAARKEIAEGIAAILPHAQSAGVKLSIEPLHPMYADNRSGVNTVAQANRIIDSLGSPAGLGIAVDAYHIWYHDALEEELRIAGERGRVFAWHLCDWRTPTVDLLNDRGIPGEGCIPLAQIGGWVRAAGFTGFDEIEIFSNYYWKMDQQEFLNLILEAYKKL